MFTFQSKIYAYKEFSKTRLLAYYVDGTLDSDASLNIYNKRTGHTERLYIPYKLNTVQFLSQQENNTFILGTADNAAYVFTYDESLSSKENMVKRGGEIEEELLSIDTLFSEKTEEVQENSAIKEINKIEGDYSGPSKIVSLSNMKLLLSAGRHLHIRVISDDYANNFILKEGKQDGIADACNISYYDGNIIIGALNGIQCVNLKRRGYGFIKSRSELALIDEKIRRAVWAMDGSNFYLQTEKSLFLYSINNFDQKFIADCTNGFYITDKHIYSFTADHLLEINRESSAVKKYLSPTKNIQQVKIIDPFVFLTVKNETVILFFSSLLRDSRESIICRDNIYYHQVVNINNVQLANFDLLMHLRNELSTIPYESIDINNQFLQHILFNRTVEGKEMMEIPTAVLTKILAGEEIKEVPENANKYILIFLALKYDLFEPLFSFAEKEMAIVYYILLVKKREDLLSKITIPEEVRKYAELKFEEVELKDYALAINLSKNEDRKYLETLLTGQKEKQPVKPVLEEQQKMKKNISIESLSQQLLNLNKSPSPIRKQEMPQNPVIQKAEPVKPSNISEIKNKYFTIVDSSNIDSLLYRMKKKQIAEVGNKSFDQLNQNPPSFEFNELFNNLFFLIQDYREIFNSKDRSRLTEFNMLLQGSATEQARQIDMKFNCKLAENLVTLLLLGLKFKLKQI